MEKKFKVREGGYLRWFYPDRFEIDVTLSIDNPDTFRQFMRDFNERHPDLVQKAEGGTVTNPNPDQGKYLQKLIEEYLGA